MRTPTRLRPDSIPADAVDDVLDDAQAQGAPAHVLNWLTALLRDGEAADGGERQDIEV